MEPFATVEDYEDRYGVVDDPSRVETLLADASAFIAGQPGFALAEGDEAQASALTMVACSVVRRSLSAGAWAGLSNVSQGAGGYTASATVYNPSGDLYLTKSERVLLGLGGGRVGMTNPFGRG